MKLDVVTSGIEEEDRPCDSCDVLIEYEGPHVALLRRAERDHIAVRFDSDEGVIRWLEAAVTRTELDALYSRATTLRRALHKREAWIVDTAEDMTCLASWRVNGQELPEEALPGPASFLPVGFMEVDESAPVSDGVSLRLDGGGVHVHNIGIRSLASILDTFQRLWSAVAQALETEPTPKGPIGGDIECRAMLAFAAAAPGSVVLNLEATDAGLSARVAEAFQRLVNHEPRALPLEERDQLGGRVSARFAEFLSAVSRSNVEVFTQWRGGSSFVAPHFARALQPFSREDQEATVEILPVMEGHFVSYNEKNRRFAFVDTRHGASYTGRVAINVVERHAGITVGAEARYSATIQVSELAGQLSHLMIDLERSAPRPKNVAR